jgi:hypothetical protein
MMEGQGRSVAPTAAMQPICDRRGRHTAPEDGVKDGAGTACNGRFNRSFIMKITPQMVKVGNKTFIMSTKFVFLAICDR